MAFFLAFRGTINNDPTQIFQNVHAQQRFEKCFNAIFVALITKTVGANELGHCRPISLITGVYRIIAEVLTERLKKVISQLVNKHQMAFIKGRQIMDASLLASEYIHSTIRGGTPGLMCKLDTEKAYDHLNWEFLIIFKTDGV